MSSYPKFVPVLLLLAVSCGAACAAGDIVSDVCRQAPAAGISHDGMLRVLKSLQDSPRVTYGSLGKSRQGRSIPIVVVRDPQVPLENTVRVFIIARQHGNEESGMTACLALAKHFASSDGQLEKDLLRQLSLVMVPAANPDGMAAWRRGNSGGTDLNRDWHVFSQPETRAIAAAVKKYQPQALIDMHELPASSSKPAYRDNFIETIGRHSRLPAQLTADCTSTSARLASWMGQCRIPVNVYYDVPGDSLNLCHRYFGLAQGIPSYLFEAKCGAGRGLAQRTMFHVLGTLVVANYALHRYYEPGEDEPQMAVVPEPAVSTAPEPVQVSLSGTRNQQVTRGQLPLVAEVKGGPTGAYVLFHVDGVMKALTNAAPHQYLLDTRCYKDGALTVEIQVCDAGGQVLGQTSSTFMVDNRAAAGE